MAGVAGHLLVEIRGVHEADPSQPRFDDCPYLTVSLGTRESYQSTEVHGPSPGVDGRSLATEVEWYERFRLPVAQDTTPRSLGSLAANLQICAYAAPPHTWSPAMRETAEDPLLRDSKLAEQIGKALVDLRDVLHPQLSKKYSDDGPFWSRPLRVALKQRTRVSSAAARRAAPVADARGAAGDQFFYSSGGGWDSTTSVTSPSGLTIAARSGRSPTATEGVDVTGHVDVAIKFEPARKNRARDTGAASAAGSGTVETHGHERVGVTSGRSPVTPTTDRDRQAQLALPGAADDKGAAALMRLEELSHTDEIEHLKRGLKACSYRGFEGQDPRKLFHDFCSRGGGSGGINRGYALDCDQFLRMCRKGARMQIHKGSKKEKEICDLFDALDLDGDEHVTIDELTAFVWDEPVPLPPGFEYPDRSGPSGLQVSRSLRDPSLWDDEYDEGTRSSASSTGLRPRGRSASTVDRTSRSGSMGSIGRGSRSRLGGDSTGSESDETLSLSARSGNPTSRSRGRNEHAHHGSLQLAAVRKELLAEGLPVTGSESELRERLSKHWEEQERAEEEQRRRSKRLGGRGERANSGGKTTSPRSARRSPQRSPQRTPAASRGQLQLRRSDYDGDSSRSRSHSRARSPSDRSPSRGRSPVRGRSPSRPMASGNRTGGSRRSPSPSGSRAGGAGNLHTAHTFTSERKARHIAAVNEERSRRARSRSPEARRRERSPSAKRNGHGTAAASGRTASSSSSPWKSPSPRRLDSGYEQSSASQSVRSPGSASAGPRRRAWDSDSSEEDNGQNELPRRSMEPQAQADPPKRHAQQRRQQRQRDEDEDSLEDEAEREEFSRGAVGYSTRISGGGAVVDRGRRTHPRLSPGSDTRRAHLHAQESGVGQSLVLSPAAPSMRYSEGGQPGTSRLTVGDLGDSAGRGKRRDGYEPPSRRVHAPSHAEQLYVHGRHHRGSHALVHGDDRLQSRRSNPNMTERARGESRDSSIAVHTRDASVATAAAVTDGGGGGGDASPELRVAFSA